MKKAIAIIAVLGTYTAFFCKKANAWFGKTHKDILEKALTLLETQNGKKYYTFYKDYTDELLRGSVDPDSKGDMDKGSGMHYYCAADKNGKEQTEKNGYYPNRLGKYKPSARTLLEDNYTAAVSQYKSGNIKGAMYSLGRAIHFIQDTGCVVHASGLIYADKPNNPHNAFETFAQTKRKSIDAPSSLDKSVLRTYEGGLGAAANRSAKLSSKYTVDVKTLDPKLYDSICEETLPASQQFTAGLLIKFYNDVQGDNAEHIIDKKSYCFKNELTGGYLTVTAKGLVLDAPNRELEQRLTVIFREDGTFALRTKNGSYIGKNCKGIEKLDNAKNASGMRISAVGNRRFRISSQGSDYKKVLTADRRGRLIIKDFKPDDSGNIWNIY